MLRGWVELRSLMAWGKKLLLSLSVFAIRLRKRLPDGSRVKRPLPVCQITPVKSQKVSGHFWPWRAQVWLRNEEIQRVKWPKTYFGKLYWKCNLFFYFDWSSIRYMEREGFMTWTAASPPGGDQRARSFTEDDWDTPGASTSHNTSGHVILTLKVQDYGSGSQTDWLTLLFSTLIISTLQ